MIHVETVRFESYFQFMKYVLVMVVAIVSSCREPSEPGKNRLDTISSLQAFSKDSSSVGLAWTSFPESQMGYVLNQSVTVTTNAAAVDSFVLPGSATNTLISGLTEGTIYEFTVTVHANDKSPFLDSVPLGTQWSPAKRFTVDAQTHDQLRLYESDSNMPQALRFYSDALGGPQVISLLDSARVNMDIYFQSATLQLRSGSLYMPSPSGRTTLFASLLPLDTESLDAPQAAAVSPDVFTLDNVTLDPLSVTGKIYFAKTSDDHYVRIFVAPGPGGTLVQGIAPNRYIQIELSYQSSAGIRYAENLGNPSILFAWAPWS